MYDRDLNSHRPHYQSGWFVTTWWAVRIWTVFCMLCGAGAVLLALLILHVRIGWQ